MAQAALRHLLLGVAASGLLAGCVAGTGGDTDDGGGVLSAAATTPRGAGAEVEAPDVFQTTESALWDGRPSLGGIWVASPDAIDPERVVIVNTATGASVTGALFRRERDNPGPALQVSSDAAEALGMLAGQPAELRVTALRREEVEPEAPLVVELDPAAVAEVPIEAPPAPTEAEALAAAALDATGATAAVAEDGTTATDPALAAEEPVAPKTWKERRAEAKAKREAAKAQREAERAAAAAAKAAAEGEAAPIDIVPVDPAASAVAAIETAPLDAGAPEAVSPVVEAPSAPPAPEPNGAARTIQIALFSKEDNANRAVEALSKIDIPAQVRRADRNGTPSWSVVAQGDAALLSKIRSAGFADAYFLQ